MATSEHTSEHGAADNRAFAVEQHGIDHIPETSRNATPREIFFTWFGANVIFTYIVIGAIVGSLGLSLWQSLTVVVLGNLAYVLVGLTSVAGPRAGTAMLTVSRSAFGIVGNRLPAVLSWLTTIGWTTVNMVIGTLSLVTLADLTGLGSGTGTKVLALVLVTAVTVAITVLGHATILVVNTVLSFALGIGTLVLGVLVIGKASASTGGGGGGLGLWLVAFAIVASAPLSYVNTGADYSRYLPVRTPARTVTLVTALGSFIPATLIGAVGVVAASVTDMTDPIAGLQSIVPEALLIAYLAVVVGGTITNNFLNTYSSGMSLLAVGVSTTRTRATALNIALALAVTCYVVFFRDFSEFLTAFLSLMIVWSSAWCGVFLADMALRRARYDVDGLQRTSGGPYWFRGGWNVPAVAWFVAGSVVSALLATSTIWTGPLTSWVDGGDLSVPAGLLIAGVGYYLHARARGLADPPAVGSGRPRVSSQAG